MLFWALRELLPRTGSPMSTVTHPNWRSIGIEYKKFPAASTVTVSDSDDDL